MTRRPFVTSIVAGTLVAIVCAAGASPSSADAKDALPAGPYVSTVVNQEALGTRVPTLGGMHLFDVSMVTMPDGRIRAFFATEGRGLQVADSADGGRTFTYVGASFNNEPGTGGAPRVMKLPDRRLRLYAAGRAGSIACYVSSDWATFTLEKLDCINGSISPAGKVMGGGYVQLPDGTYRAYVSEAISPETGPRPSSIYSLSSPDGLNWTPDPGIRIGPGQPATPASRVDRSGNHPTAVMHPDGSVGLFFYDDGSGTGNSGPRWEQRGLYYARSTDRGITFAPATRIALKNSLSNIFGSDPDVILRPDGAMLLAAGGYNNEIKGHIGTYVLTPGSTPTTPAATTSAKKITCSKKGVKRVFTASKCPAGWRRTK